jgi:hypothetical protein
MKRNLRKYCQILPIGALLLVLYGCNSGGSSWRAGNLGTLGISLANTVVNVNGTTTVTATLTNPKQGTDAIGGAKINFYIGASGSSFESAVIYPSNVATVSPATCTISNLLESSVVSCTTTLTGAVSGSAQIFVEAIPTVSANTLPPLNGTVFESFVVQ